MFQQAIQQMCSPILKNTNMENIDFEYAKRFINSTVELLKDTLDKDTIEAVRHYLIHDECEMAFEGLFIEIMNLTQAPEIDFIKSREVAKLLKLDKESVFDYNFWENFNEYVTQH